MADLLCLKWNNHSSSFSKLLNNLYTEDTFSDASIFCNGKVYPVHRFVLSTCSEFFEHIFKSCKNSNDKHPIIIVKDIKKLQLEALLCYMYKGQVNVPQEVLPELIKTAESLKIRGLALSNDQQNSSPIQSKKRSSASSPNVISKKCRPTITEHGSSENCNISETLSNSENEEDSNIIGTGLIGGIKPLVSFNKVGSQLNDFLSNKHGNVHEEDGNSLKNQLEDDTIHDDMGSNFGDFDGMQATSSNDYDEENGASHFLDHKIVIDTSPLALAVDQPKVIVRGGVHMCPYCAYQTVRKSHLTRHMRTHTGEKPFCCPYCNFKAGRNDKLQRHLKLHMLEDSDDYKCSVCPYTTSQHEELICHMSTHMDGSGFLDENDIPDDFEETPEEAEELAQLMDGVHDESEMDQQYQEILTATAGEKRLVCNYCPYETKWKECMNAHMKYHTGERQFSCGSCSYITDRKDLYQEHAATHIGRVFKCTLCSYKCGFKNRLVMHMRTHSGEAPYGCEKCGFKAKSKQSLNYHQKMQRCSKFQAKLNKTTKRQKKAAAAAENQRTSSRNKSKTEKEEKTDNLRLPAEEGKLLTEIPSQTIKEENKILPGSKCSPIKEENDVLSENKTSSINKVNTNSIENSSNEEKESSADKNKV